MCVGALIWQHGDCRGRDNVSTGAAVSLSVCAPAGKKRSKIGEESYCQTRYFPFFPNASVIWTMFVCLLLENDLAGVVGKIFYVHRFPIGNNVPIRNIASGQSMKC